MLKILIVLPALNKNQTFLFMDRFLPFLTHYYFSDTDHKFIFKSYIWRPYLIIDNLLWMPRRPAGPQVQSEVEAPGAAWEGLSVAYARPPRPFAWRSQQVGASTVSWIYQLAQYRMLKLKKICSFANFEKHLSVL